MSFFESLLAWANLPFTAALATVLTFAGLQATGVLGLLAGGDAEHDADGGDGHDADVDHDLDGDADHDADTDHDSDQEQQSGTGLLATVGIGRLPTSIVWQTFAMSFGMLGVVTNSIVWMTTHSLPLTALALSFPVALVGGFGLTAAIAKTVTKLVKPPSEAPGKRDLVGLSGVVMSGEVDEHFGEIRVKAQHGDYVSLPCRVLPGERPVGHHEPVVIVKYDRVDDRFYVAPVPADSNESQPMAVRERI